MSTTATVVMWGLCIGFICLVMIPIALRDQTLRIKLIDPACEPYKKHTTDAGWDLRSREYFLLMPGAVKRVGAGICVEIPTGYVGDIRPRSSITQKGLVVPIGTVDSSYRGEIGIIIINASNSIISIAKGERIAQLVITPCLLTRIQKVNELSQTERGTNGFGSTGK